MSRHEVPPGTEILLVYDAKGVYNKGKIRRDGIAAAVRRASREGVIRQADQDFWVAHPFPLASGKRPASRYQSGNPPLIRMQDRVDTYNESLLEDYLWTFAQEFGHHWLVPRFTAKLSRNRRRKASTGGAFVRAVTRNKEIPDLAVLGRSNAHWSSYLASGSSPMMGLHWVQDGAFSGGSGLDRYILRQRPTIPFSAPVLGPQQGPVYNDLDRTFMGVIQPSAAYRYHRNHFRWLEPRYMTKLLFHMGLALVFDSNDIVYFGPFGNSQRLRVERTGRRKLAEWTFYSGFRPWDGDASLFLRVVIQSGTLYFQARIGPRGLSSRDALYENLERPPRPVARPSRWNVWNTIYVMRPRRPLKAVGYIVKTWNGGEGGRPMMDVEFGPLHMRRRGTPWASGLPASIPFHYHVSKVSMSSSMALPRDLGRLKGSGFTFHCPKQGPFLRPKRPPFNMFVPHGKDRKGYDHRRGVDEAPKLLVAAPDRLEAVVGSLWPRRTILVPWAEGSVPDGAHLYAVTRSLPTRRIILPKKDSAKRSYDPSEGYKGLFVLVTDRRNAAPLRAVAQELDNYRLAVEAWVQASTGRLLRTTAT